MAGVRHAIHHRLPYNPVVSGPFAYFLTFTTYGARLHGDERGSWTRATGSNLSLPVESNEARLTFEQTEMAHEPIVFDDHARSVVDQAVHDVCLHREWQLLGLNVRTNHVHVLVSGSGKPEAMLQGFKSWSTKRLREDGLFPPGVRIWTRHGSTRYVWSEADAEDVWLYVVHGQDIQR